MKNEQLEILKLQFENKEILSFFDCLSDILLKVSGGNLNEFPEFGKHFSKYMICRYLSMRKNLFPFSEYLNKVQMSLTDMQFYKLAYKIIPKQNSGFIKYIKKQKKEEAEKEEKQNNAYISFSIFD